MLLHFIVISLFEESWAAEAKVGPMDPDLAHQSVAQTLRRAGIRASGWPLDPMWYLMREGKIIGYVKVFREEMYARNWFRDLAEKEGSKNFGPFGATVTRLHWSMEQMLRTPISSSNQ